MPLSVREPTAIIIGTFPSAASWMLAALVSRPDVHQPGTPTSVAALTSGDIHAYLRPFSDWAGESVSLDTVDLLRHRARPAELAPRLAELLPSTRLIVVLRAPWERAAQAFAVHRAAGRIDAHVSFTNYLHTVDHRLDPLEVMSGGQYAGLLEPFLAGSLPLLVISEEELIADPARSWMEVLGFLGLHWEPDATPGALLRADSESRPWALPDPGLTDDDVWFCRRFYEGSGDAIDRVVGRPITQTWRSGHRGR